MEIYILEEFEPRDDYHEVLGAFSSLEKVNDAIKGKIYGNKEFKGVDELESLLAKNRGWYYLTKTTLDKDTTTTGG